MNRSLPAAPECIVTYDNLQVKSDGEGLNTRGRTTLFKFTMAMPMKTTCEDATMLARISLTIADVVFSAIIATRSRMLTMKTGRMMRRVLSKLKYEKLAEGSSTDIKLSLLLLLAI